MATNIESSRPTTKNYDRRENSAFQFLIFCLFLTAMIFGLIRVVTYSTNSTDSTDAADRTAHTSATARTSDKPILSLDR